MIPGDPASRDALAGEYVLGTLDAQAAAAVQAAMATDPALRAAVEAWEARLGPLARLAPPEAPPPDLWHRIEARIAPAAPARLARRIGFWRGWAIGASLAAAGFAALAVLPRGPGPAEGQGGVPSLAGADRTGVVSLADGDSTSGVVVDQSADGTVMELWAVPPGAPGPVSLGVLRRGGGHPDPDHPGAARRLAHRRSHRPGAVQRPLERGTSLDLDLALIVPAIHVLSVSLRTIAG